MKRIPRSHFAETNYQIDEPVINFLDIACYLLIDLPTELTEYNCLC